MSSSSMMHDSDRERLARLEVSVSHIELMLRDIDVKLDKLLLDYTTFKARQTNGLKKVGILVGGLVAAWETVKRLLGF
ncbi:MAG: hypothetical protein QXO86_06880 [Nitrososphaerota archaeon]